VCVCVCYLWSSLSILKEGTRSQLQRRFYQTAPICNLCQIVHIHVYPIFSPWTMFFAIFLHVWWSACLCVPYTYISPHFSCWSFLSFYYQKKKWINNFFFIKYKFMPCPCSLYTLLSVLFTLFHIFWEIPLFLCVSECAIVWFCYMFSLRI
jgi:hypothetical protein